jgi:hypothetical protein|tara:strand:+ start:69 stop:767 length:699 start_codon:yes stop_codon:yes gene_type:complete
MKKYLLSLVTLLLVMTSCQKEDDLLQPIPPNPNTQINTNINVDTTAIVGGDTILVQGIEEDLVATDYVTSNTTTEPTTFIGEGKTWKIVESGFEINCSELTSSHVDTSYSYVSNPYDILSSSTISFNDDYYGEGHDIFTVNIYPRNGTGSPVHALDFAPNFMTMYVDNYTYNMGTLTMNLTTLTCSGVWISWTVHMDIIEDGDGGFKLEITQSGSHAGISWDSHQYLLLEEI